MTVRPLVLTLLLAFKFCYASTGPVWFENEEFSGSGSGFLNNETPDKQELSAVMEIIDELVRKHRNTMELSPHIKDEITKFKDVPTKLIDKGEQISGFVECVKYIHTFIKEKYQIGLLETYGGETGPGIVSEKWKMRGYKGDVEGKTTLRYNNGGLESIEFILKGK